MESVMIAECGADRYWRHNSFIHLEEVLKDIEYATDLLEKLFQTYSKRLNAMRHANGGHIIY